MYLLLADAVIIVHFLFIAFVVAGGLLVLWRPHWAWLHVPAAVWGVAVEYSGWICPLTPLENHLRHLGGQSTYGGDFVIQYLLPVIYPINLTVATQYILGSLVLVINAVLYFFVIRRARK